MLFGKLALPTETVDKLSTGLIHRVYCWSKEGKVIGSESYPNLAWYDAQPSLLYVQCYSIKLLPVAFYHRSTSKGLRKYLCFLLSCACE